MQVTDPVCRMTVDTSSAAAQGTYDGETVYFCSSACQRTFEKRRDRARA